jgi:hypothetical protein
MSPVLSAKDVSAAYGELALVELPDGLSFSPAGATCETEDHRVELLGLTVLELIITPDISGRNALASPSQLEMA